MNQTVDTQELAIIVAVRDHNPTILTLDFLKYSGIVPSDWELARAPFNTNHVAQVTFQNGISIVAEPQRVMFLEAIEGKAAGSILVPDIARRYSSTLPNVDYQAIGLNFRGYVDFDNQQDAARKYLAQTLLSPGPWQDFGTAPVRATVNFAYTLEHCSFNLSVNEAVLRLTDEKIVPIVLFSGNFSYEIASNASDERLQSLQQILENWQADLETYSKIVNTKFLTRTVENKSILPDLFAMSASTQA